MALPNTITITELSQRSGVQPSALRFYESIGLIRSERTGGNHRRYPRAILRVVSVIRAAQGLGLSLQEIGEALKSLPEGRTPTPEDWERMATAWGTALDERIAQMRKLRDDLSGCIGCGCLSLERCALLNQEDHVGRRGAGPRYLMGDAQEQR
jgi:MerR family redox-sensitive transcriptional activator SoxR